MKKVTAKKLKKDLLEICDQYPELRNPMEPGGDSCVYYSDRFSPGQSQRCLIGEWLSRQGVAVQQLQNQGADSAMLDCDGFFDATEKARQTAFCIQQYADNDGNPRPWGVVAKALRDGEIKFQDRWGYGFDQSV